MDHFFLPYNKEYDLSRFMKFTSDEDSMGYYDGSGAQNWLKVFDLIMLTD